LERKQARLDLIAHCQKMKERFVAESGALRLHSIFLQFFADLADYVQTEGNAALDMLDVREVLSPRSWWLR
jgi:hypothetical protein